jgi:hypothetical protein
VTLLASASLSPPNWVEVTAITTGALALATFLLAGLTWWGIRGNRQLIDLEQRQVASLQRQTDLLWENAVPYLFPQSVHELGGEGLEMTGRLVISYAAGTVPARSITAWVGAEGKVWTGGTDLLTFRDEMRWINLGQSRAGSEPPAEWGDWLVKDDQNVSWRVLMRWAGPGDNWIQRAWQFSWEHWSEVATPVT